MYRFALLPFLLLFTVLGFGQEVQWLTNSPIGYEINPDLPQHLIATSDAEHVYVARSVSLTYLYGEVYGTAVVEQRNAEGAVNWSFALGDSLLLQRMASSPDGRVVLGGRFFRRVLLNGSTEIPLVNGTLYPETFLLALDSNGELLWQRNISNPDPQGMDVQDITFDPQGRFWYATCDFNDAEIKRVDEEGNDVETRLMGNAKTIGAISFDLWGGLYVSGGANNPGLTVNGTYFPVVPEYNFFVTRMAQSGEAQWLQTAEDITFQRPIVKADAFGHAYLVGSPFDSLTFGGIHFEAPEWNTTIFLARLDSMGTFQWGYQPPLGAPFSGQFELANAGALDVNADGDVVLLGKVNGVVEWGNGLVTNAGTLQDRAVVVLELDSSATPQWELHGGSADYDVPQGLAVLPDGICHIAVQARDTFNLGPFTANISSSELIVARIGPNINTAIANTNAALQDLRIFPSPFADEFSISAAPFHGAIMEVLVHESTGRLVSRGHKLNGLGGALAPGCYVVEVRQGDRRWYGRVVKQ